MTTRSEAILDEWFGELDTFGQSSNDKAQRWFTKDAKFDEYLRVEYGADVEKAAQGELPEGNDALRIRLAALILLDQFTRNIYRGTQKMYAADGRALELAREVLNDPACRQLPVAYQVFACMPLMHAEDLAAQEECMRQFEALLEAAPESQKESLKSSLHYARLHRDIVARFGRFPHRNAILGRATTPEEAKFLEGPNSSF